MSQASSHSALDGAHTAFSKRSACGDSKAFQEEQTSFKIFTSSPIYNSGAHRIQGHGDDSFDRK